MTWRSKKQVIVTRPSVEVEFRAIGIYKLLWLRILLTELRTEKIDPMRLY